MTTEEKFQGVWLENCKKMEELGIPAARMTRSIGELGALSAARRLLSRRRNSDGFALLAQRERLDLSLEALVVQGRFGGLFTDEEADFCLQSLLEAGYYGSAGA